MVKLILFMISEYGFLTVLLGAFAFGSWTKITIGAALAVVGALFPSQRPQPGASGKVEIAAFGNKLSVSGAARFALKIGGIHLISSSNYNGAEEYSASHIKDISPALRDKLDSSAIFSAMRDICINYLLLADYKNSK